jgi:hypothetical protein
VIARRCNRVFGCECGRCLAIWGRDRKRVISSALRGDLRLVTLTAPGAEVLPWACPIAHRHDGRNGCKVDRVEADAWNASVVNRERRLRRAVLGRLRRRGFSRVVAAKVWEPQGRGVAHAHYAVGLAAHRPFVAALKELAPRYGFGFVDDGRGHRGGGGVGGYLGGYLGSGGKVEAVAAAVEDGVIPHRSWWVSPELTRYTGVTMRSLRLVRKVWAHLQGLIAPPAATGCGWLWARASRAGAAGVGGPTEGGGARRAPPSRLTIAPVLAVA